MIKKQYILIWLLLMLSLKSFGTAQVPDLLIYKGDTLRLYTNPLEDLYNEQNPRPKTFGLQGGWSTACWRGYRATWLVEGDILYLVEIGPCHYRPSYSLTSSVLDSLIAIIPSHVAEKLYANNEKIYGERDFEKYLENELGERDYGKYGEIINKLSVRPRVTANLEKLFPARFKDGRIKADWFFGVLRSPKGKLLNYVHMGYMSTYEYELVFEVEKGRIINFKEFSNEEARLEEGYGVITATSYSLAVPVNFLEGENYEYTLTDTISYSDPGGKMLLECHSKFNNERLNPEKRNEKVSVTLNALTRASPPACEFGDPINDNLRWGTAGWVDGYNSNTKEFIRIFTIININGQMIMTFRCKSEYEEFYRISQNIVRSVRLMEFGY